MVLDSSALIAILQDEPERSRFLALLEKADLRVLSAATAVEVSIIVLSRQGERGIALLEAFMTDLRIEPVPVTADHVQLAIDAFRRFGKGRHPAGLNFGDCFSYALAKTTGEPLLFKGDDFSRTDIQRAA